MENNGKSHDSGHRAGGTAQSHSQTPSPTSLNLDTWRIAGPVILANSSVPLLGAVDTAVMGHMPDPAYLGAIALGSMIFMLLYTVFNFLRMATTGLAAESWGKWQRKEDTALELGRVFARAALLAAAIGLGLIALQGLLGWAAFALFNAEAGVETLARRYFDIRIWSAPATLVQFAVVGWLLGTRRAGMALVVQVFMNLLNIALNILFVIGFGWGVEGVALATLVAEYAAAILALGILIRILRHDHGTALSLVFARASLIDARKMGRLLSLNGNLFLRTLCLLTAFGIFTAIGARLGTLVLAVNMVLMNFHHFMAFGLDGFAFAAEALVGSEKDDTRRMRRVIRVTSLWAVAASVVYALVYGVGGIFLIGLLTGIDDVRAMAATYLPWMAIMPIIAVASYQLDGVFVGLTRGRDMRNSMAISFVAFLLSVAVLVPLVGNHGLWAAFIVMLMTRGVTLGWKLKQILRSTS